MDRSPLRYLRAVLKTALALRFQLLQVVPLVLAIGLYPGVSSAVPVDPVELEKAISERRKLVTDFALVAKEAEQRGLRVFLSGGLAASYGDFVKHQLLSEKGLLSIRSTRIANTLVNIVLPEQDLDVVIARRDGSPETVQELRNFRAWLDAHLPKFLDGKSKWDVNGLKTTDGNHIAVSGNPDFARQNNDSLSIGLIELTPPPAGESVVSEANHIAKKGAERVFLNDLAGDKVSFLHSPEHALTSRAAAGNNPEILGAIRTLTKALQYDKSIRKKDAAEISRIIDKFEPSQLQHGSYAYNWVNGRAGRLVYHAYDPEKALELLDGMGLRQKLFKLSDPTQVGSLAWWMSKEPLPLDPSRLKAGNGVTAGQLGLRQVAHETTHEVQRMITWRYDGRPRAFQSRQGMPGETAHHGKGFYTQKGTSTEAFQKRVTGSTIVFDVDPSAVLGRDFEVFGDGGTGILWKGGNGLVARNEVHSYPNAASRLCNPAFANLSPQAFQAATYRRPSVLKQFLGVRFMGFPAPAVLAVGGGLAVTNLLMTPEPNPSQNSPKNSSPTAPQSPPTPQPPMDEVAVPSAPHSRNFSAGGLTLKPGEKIQLNLAHLDFQGDGNLVMVSNSGRVLWNAGTVFSAPGCAADACSAPFQGDGNLVLYHDGEHYWDTGTVKTGSQMLISDSGSYLKIFNSQGEVVWRSNPEGVSRPAATSPASGAIAGSSNPCVVALGKAGFQDSRKIQAFCDFAPSQRQTEALLKAMHLTTQRGWTFHSSAWEQFVRLKSEASFGCLDDLTATDYLNPTQKEVLDFCIKVTKPDQSQALKKAVVKVTSSGWNFSTQHFDRFATMTGPLAFSCLDELASTGRINPLTSVETFDFCAKVTDPRQFEALKKAMDLVTARGWNYSSQYFGRFLAMKNPMIGRCLDDLSVTGRINPMTSVETFDFCAKVTDPRQSEALKKAIEMVTSRGWNYSSQYFDRFLIMKGPVNFGCLEDLSGTNYYNSLTNLGALDFCAKTTDPLQSQLLRKAVRMAADLGWSIYSDIFSRALSMYSAAGIQCMERLMATNFFNPTRGETLDFCLGSPAPETLECVVQGAQERKNLIGKCASGPAKR